MATNNIYCLRLKLFCALNASTNVCTMALESTEGKEKGKKQHSMT